MPPDELLNKQKKRSDWPLRDLTPQQWAAISAELPEPPTRKARSELVTYINFCQMLGRTTPKKRARLLTKAAEEVRSAIEKVNTAAPLLVRLLRDLSKIHVELESNAEATRYFITKESPDRAHDYRHQFLGDALKFWETCGGKLKFSRDKSSGKPSGPLIRYLIVVSRLAMKDKAPRPDTLVDFIVKRRRSLLRQPHD